MNLLRIRSLRCAAFLSFCVFATGSSSATSAGGRDYPESGTVSSMSSKGGYVYVVATEKRLYQLLCARYALFGQPECKLDGKPIAAGDVLHFRLEKDFAYIAEGMSGDEEKFRILMTTLKETPKPPAVDATQGAASATPQKENGVVIGTGVQVKGAKGSYLSAPAAGAPGAQPATGIATGPVVGVPVTGGAPVTVVPVAPAANGAPVIGVPTAGGAPVTVVPVAPVGGAGMPPAGGAGAGGVPRSSGGGGGPVWVHLALVQTQTHAYELECSTKPCELGDKPIELGDNLTFRIEKNWAYFAIDPNNPKREERFKILKDEPIAAASQAKPADDKQQSPAP
jgi:hypothetical protein